MNDPIISAIAAHWMLSLGFVCSASSMGYGWVMIRTATRSDPFWPYGLVATTAFLVGVVGVIDCTIRALR